MKRGLSARAGNRLSRILIQLLSGAEDMAFVSHCRRLTCVEAELYLVPPLTICRQDQAEKFKSPFLSSVSNSVRA